MAMCTCEKVPLEILKADPESAADYNISTRAGHGEAVAVRRLRRAGGHQVLRAAAAQGARPHRAVLFVNFTERREFGPNIRKELRGLLSRLAGDRPALRGELSKSEAGTLIEVAREMFALRRRAGRRPP
jgi:EAL domain-containing protein (putative c-di-GMP-specific phosphodiesterase class I)